MFFISLISYSGDKERKSEVDLTPFLALSGESLLRILNFFSVQSLSSGEKPTPYGSIS